MSTPKKTPSHSVPAYVCARLRKLLAAKGWPMHKMTGRYSPFGGGQFGTEGFEVHKVGCSKWVAVSYRPAYGSAGSGTLDKGVARARTEEAREYLRSLGYRVDDRGWVECDEHDSCDW